MTLVVSLEKGAVRADREAVFPTSRQVQARLLSIRNGSHCAGLKGQRVRVARVPAPPPRLAVQAATAAAGE